MGEFKYIGEELDLFSTATNWKRYWSYHLKPYVGRRVLDVGAGIGSTIDVLCTDEQDKWIALEPDPALAARLTQIRSGKSTLGKVEVRTGTLDTMPSSEKFDTILYIDVLEHIEEDRQELEKAARKLTSDGKIVVLSPAHEWLFTAFDESIGHFRRYTKASLQSIIPSSLRVEKIFYLDLWGCLQAPETR